MNETGVDGPTSEGERKRGKESGIDDSVQAGMPAFIGGNLAVVDSGAGPTSADASRSGARKTAAAQAAAAEE